MNNQKRVLFIVIFALVFLFLMTSFLLIFQLGRQPGEESGGLASQPVTQVQSEEGGGLLARIFGGRQTNTQNDERAAQEQGRPEDQTGIEEQPDGQTETSGGSTGSATVQDGTSTNTGNTSAPATCSGIINKVFQLFTGDCPARAGRGGGFWNGNGGGSSASGQDSPGSAAESPSCNLFTYVDCPVEESLYWDPSCPYLVDQEGVCIDWEGPYRDSLCDPSVDDECVIEDHPFYSEDCSTILNIFTGECLEQPQESQEDSGDGASGEEPSACEEPGWVQDASGQCGPSDEEGSGVEPENCEVMGGRLDQSGNCTFPEEGDPGVSLNEGWYYLSNGLYGFEVPAGQGTARKSGSTVYVQDASNSATSIEIYALYQDGIADDEALGATLIDNIINASTSGAFSAACDSRYIGGILTRCVTVVRDLGNFSVEYYGHIDNWIVQITVYPTGGDLEQEVILDSFHYYPRSDFRASATAL